MKSFKFNITPMIIVILSILFNYYSLISQIVRNGSFEKHKTGTYPQGISGAKSYTQNALMKCIGFCLKNDLFDWPPFWNTMQCDYHMIHDTINEGGWYWPTDEASPDYFHRLGFRTAQVPYVETYNLSEYHRENRWPYGYINSNSIDSAFIGLRIYVNKPDKVKGNIPKFTNYKEYIQSRLNSPLVGPSKFEVKFYVSKSRYSLPSLMKIGAYFSTNAICNPTRFAEKYNINLSLTNPPDDLQFITNPQVCSNFRLDQTADEYGFGGWQEISGTLIVPDGVIYNYITIGNFQSDQDLYEDLDTNIYGNKKYGVAYYFVDEVSITPMVSNVCRCESSLMPIEINKHFPENDPTQCCYEYKIIIPDSSAKWTYALCNIHKIQIRKGEEILVEEIAAEGEDFAGIHFDGTFCVEKFNTYNNDFTIVFYKRDSNGEYIPLERCSKTIKLNCVCNCINFHEYPRLEDRLSLDFIKVDSSASGRCCWDIVFSNPGSNDSAACEYDLSGLYLLVKSNRSQGYYEFSSTNIPFTQGAWLQKWTFPDPFIIKPGETVQLGQVCANGIPPESYQNQVFNFILSNDTTTTWGCDTICKKTLACDTTLLCCENWEIRYDSVSVYTGPRVLSDDYCGTYIHLYYLNSIAYCNLLDTFHIALSTSNNIISQEFDLVPATLSSGELINISPFLIFNDSIRACVKIINKRTLDTCERCTTIYCGYMLPILPNEMEQGGGELFKNSIGDLPEDLNIIKIVPHPIESNFEVHLISRNKESSKIKIFDLMGIEVYSIDYDIVEGFNKISVNNFDLANGTYILTITTDDKIKSSKIQIMR
ncbi:MAG TPA: T9SS type A sorting domain-containing protein, partial [Candidatus Kapabacteria bacterium]|nr:T9SS type A sorting domain-containing protein [Candidatus Kapabacteria bacterium]